MNALRKLHEALRSGARLVDTQPLSSRPSVFAAGKRLGSLDMREWAQTIRAVDEKVDRALRDGLFELEQERRFLVTDSVDDGAECLEEVGGWAGTRVSGALAARIRTADPPLTIVQEIRLRLLLKPV